MGKIKIFKEARPNPNVPFSRLPGPGSVGILDTQVSDIADRVSQQAIKYKVAKKKQKDTTDIFEAETDRQELTNESLLRNKDPSTGVFNLEGIKKDLQDQSDLFRKSMSVEAFDIYSRKSDRSNNNLLDKLFSENGAVERKNNIATFESTLGKAALNMASSSFDQMVEIQAGIDTSLMAAQDKGTFTDIEIEERRAAASKATVSSFLKLNTGFITNSVSDVDGSVRKASAFAELDPTGYFKANPGAKDLFLQDVNSKALKATKRINKENEAQESTFHKALLKQQGVNSDNLISSLGSFDSEGEREDGFDGEFSDLETRSDHFRKAEEMFEKGTLSEFQLGKVINYDKIHQNVVDAGLYSDIVDDPEGAGALISKISSPTLRKRALEAVSSKISPSFGTTYSGFKFNKLGISKADYFTSVVSHKQSFDELQGEHPNAKFTDLDLQAAVLLSFTGRLRSSPEFFVKYRLAQSREAAKARGLGLGEYTEERAKALLFELNKLQKEVN